MKSLTIIAVIALTACTRPTVKCTNGGEHIFDKWQADQDRKSMSGSQWMKRQCRDCGWQEERGADVPN